jgi:hypothetical protein
MVNLSLRGRKKCGGARPRIGNAGNTLYIQPGRRQVTQADILSIYSERDLLSSRPAFSVLAEIMSDFPVTIRQAIWGEDV